MGELLMRTARFAACFAAFAILISSVVETNAAGALAMGRCGAFGYAFDDVSPEAAAQRARAQCKGLECRVGTSFRHACAALTVEGGNGCGPHDLANAATLGRCYKLPSSRSKCLGVVISMY